METGIGLDSGPNGLNAIMIGIVGGGILGVVFGNCGNEALRVLQMRHAGRELLGPHAEVALGKCGLRLKHVDIHGFGIGVGLCAIAIAIVCLLGAFNELQIVQHALVNGTQLIVGQILHGQLERRV